MLVDYIKSASFIVFICYISCCILANIFQVLANFWLSKWSKSNEAMSNSTDLTNKEGMLVYSALGLGQSKI